MINKDGDHYYYEGIVIGISGTLVMLTAVRWSDGTIGPGEKVNDRSINTACPYIVEVELIH